MACVPASGRKSIRYLAFLTDVPTDFGTIRDIAVDERAVRLSMTRGDRSPCGVLDSADCWRRNRSAGRDLLSSADSSTARSLHSTCEASMNKLALALCVVALATVSLCAADVAGTWNVDGDVVGNPVKFPMTLQQDGEALTGTATLEGGKDVAVKGTSKEQAITFEFDSESAGSTYPPRVHRHRR